MKITARVTSNGKLMYVNEGDQTIYLDRDEAIELLEAIQSKLGEMAVLITPEKEQ
jgi:hypothetical protein